MMAMRLFSLFFLQSNPNLDSVIHRRGRRESRFSNTSQCNFESESCSPQTGGGDRVGMTTDDAPNPMLELDLCKNASVRPIVEKIVGNVEDEAVSGCAARSRLPNRKRHSRDRRRCRRGVRLVGKFGAYGLWR